MKSKILTFRTIIKKDGKAYHGFVPSLPGCHSQGNTIEETKKNLKEAISVWLESRAANNLPIPLDNGLETIEHIDISTLQIPQSTVIRYA